VIARATIVVLLLVATHAIAQNAIVGEMSTTADADHFHSLRLRGGDFFDYKSPFEYSGVAVQATHYSQSGWDTNAPAALFLWRKQRRDTLAGTIAEAGLVRVNGRTRVIGDATWSLRPNARTGFEVLAAGDLVETRSALEQATAYTFVGGDVERQLSERFTVIGLVAYQHFTDGNDRLHLRGRAIWQLVPAEGINAQIRYRQFGSQKRDVVDYFNPEHYRQWDAGLFMRKRRAGWIWFGTIAAGRETIDHDVQRTTGDVELRAEGPLPHDMRIAFRASYTRAAGFAVSDQYWYGVVGVTLVVPLR